ncbi:MAG: aminodeoxychorismate/anthranilate synthase component II [Candidatus Marinimicrobia bacterium]|nr:aminodeoxychorismate/anthranilate synthase component II [Candidatus Neomarinimicrobiota bacterium]MBL7059722.1 aminodeoxychorismate/anthranilate synthase component II [Candidatus Neomarinimicrobiota bacterium]
MILIIDNYDSFTYNLYQQIESLGFCTRVALNDRITLDEIRSLAPNKIVISPGPGMPKNAGISNDVIRTFYKDIPIFGVCLGMQCIGGVFGAKIRKAHRPTHGKIRKTFHNNTGIFQNLPTPFDAALYHSLAVDDVPDGFILSAHGKDGEIMAIQHKTYSLSGVQFHPESFMTEVGDDLMRNLLHG